MKVAVITPHRGDRPEFLEQFKKYLAAQTVQPDQTIYMDYASESGEIDITQRYRRGYEIVNAIYPEIEAVLFMEVDDWYAPDYIETMLEGWMRYNKPSLFGIGNSFYYHIAGKYFHIGLPSANAMLLKTHLQINWGPDNYPYIDVTLSKQLVLHHYTMPFTPVVVGIKHGIGLVGGGCHNEDNEHYVNDDTTGEWLKNIVGDENWEFYIRMRVSQTTKNHLFSKKSAHVPDGALNMEGYKILNEDGTLS